MKKIKLFLIFVVLLFSQFVYCNDAGIIAVGGRWVHLKTEHVSIQMVKEWININVYKDYYDVDVTFIFENKGDSTTVFMGFPESGYGDMNSAEVVKNSAFMSFSTSVDGVPFTAKREFVNEENFSGDSYLAYWIKQVDFAKNQERKVNVKYRSPVGSGVSNYYRGSDNFIEYNFTGGNWFGKVEESNLTVKFDMPVKIRKNESSKIKKKNDEYVYNQKNWEAEEYFKITYLPEK